MTTYPNTTFSSHNLPRENGGAVYAIWHSRAPGDHTMVGSVSKTRRGTWNVDIPSRYYSQRITETARFADAKQLARELLA